MIESFVYKSTEQGDLRLFVHYPIGWKSQDARPVIVFFFGGTWLAGDIEEFFAQSEHLAQQGMVAIRADYRVGQRHGVSPKECVEDARDCIVWVRRNVTKLGVDSDRIVVSGGSSGGHIAACTTLRPDPCEQSKANALILYNPVLRFSGVNRAMKIIGYDRKLGRAISPNLYLHNNPPTLMFYGDQDWLIEMGREYIQHAEVRAEMMVAEGEGHSFWHKSLWRQKTTQRMDDFLVSLGYLANILLL